MSARWTDTQIELISNLYRRICGVTTRYTFTRPVEQADLDTVAAELRAAVPGYAVTLKLEGHIQVIVRWPNGTPLYARNMIPIGGV